MLVKMSRFSLYESLCQNRFHMFTDMFLFKLIESLVFK